MTNYFKNEIRKLPNTPGVYQFLDAEGKLLYVGKSVSIKKRVASYFANKNLGPKTNKLVSQIRDIKFLKVFSEFEALMLETELIRTNQPFYNIQSKDDKSPIYIKISNDDIPLISTVRRQKPRRGEFIKGPFQSRKSTKQILKEVRRIFPYCQHKNPKKPCLYVHLGLCPYPYESLQAKQNYKETIKKIKSLFAAKSGLLTKSLIREMKAHSKAQKYEEADRVKKQLERLEILKSKYHLPAEFLETPTLVDDLNLARLSELKKILNLHKIPRRIECYDISNIQGKLATGSMVVFENGQPQKSEYRKFKIKFTHKPNDYQMIKEVLARRFKNNWQRADIMIIDGGKGQLNSALEVAAKYQSQSYIISLAKRLEEIFTPENQNSIKLPKENPARQLVQSLRDEAHRFAITYHRLLRSKNLIP